MIINSSTHKLSLITVKLDEAPKTFILNTGNILINYHNTVESSDANIKHLNLQEYVQCFMGLHPLKGR